MCFIKVLVLVYLSQNQTCILYQCISTRILCQHISLVYCNKVSVLVHFVHISDLYIVSKYQYSFKYIRLVYESLYQYSYTLLIYQTCILYQRISTRIFCQYIRLEYCINVSVLVYIVKISDVYVAMYQYSYTLSIHQTYMLYQSISTCIFCQYIRQVYCINVSVLVYFVNMSILVFFNILSVIV